MLYISQTHANKNGLEMGLGLWCLTPLSTTGGEG